MANARYEIDFRFVTERDSHGNPSWWSNSQRTIIESTDEVKAKTLLKGQYPGAQIGWINRKS